MPSAAPATAPAPAGDEDTSEAVAEPCRRCVMDEQLAGELLENDLMITLGERRLRRSLAGSLAATGLAATFAVPASMGVGAVFTTSALVAETAIGANF